MPRQYHIYILADQGRCLTIGVTAQLYRRWLALRVATVCAGCRRFHIARLVYAETAASAKSARLREEELRHWDRRRKERLIKSLNPDRLDLGIVWGWRTRPVTRLVMGVEAETERIGQH
ncbi:MAG: GIY-YIG nuclease family protein [Gemmatimonadota bacterium]